MRAAPFVHSEISEPNASKSATPSDRVFGCTGWTIARVIKRVAELAGEDPREFAAHSARAGMLTTASEAGVDLAAVMRQAGHASTGGVEASSEYKQSVTETDTNKQPVLVTVDLTCDTTSAQRKCFYEKMADLGYKKYDEPETTWKRTVDQLDWVDESISTTAKQLAEQIVSAAVDCKVPRIVGTVQVGNSRAPIFGGANFTEQTD